MSKPHLASMALWALVAAGCQSTPNAQAPWTAEYSPPPMLETTRVRVEPLHPRFARIDFDAFMSSREHLRQTLHWGDWPSRDMTIDQNRQDLRRHWNEFQHREAYAYTVLTRDGARCLGCIYLDPPEKVDARGLVPPVASLAYWVIEDEIATDLDVHLLKSVLLWIQRSWPLKSVIVPLHEDNLRGIAVAERLGLQRLRDDDDGHVIFLWTDPGAT